MARVNILGSKWIKIFMILSFSLLLIVGYVVKTNQKSEVQFKNILVVGWDGLLRSRFEGLLADGRLPNIKSLIDEGSYVEIDIAEAGAEEDFRRKTETKPGWAQIFTGYLSDDIGVVSNLDYKPIPKGYTIFERLKKKYGDAGIQTVFLSGKINNIGARGPHEICMNCRHRYNKTFTKTHWWEKIYTAPLRPGEKERVVEQRLGEPYFNTLDSLDIYKNSLGPNVNVAREGLEFLSKVKSNRFFAFFHFEEPDEIGHRYGEYSRQYSRAIMKNDALLGDIVQKLKEEGLNSNTILFVVSDHGMDPNGRRHHYAPNTMLAVNIKGLAGKGDRADLAPTFYELYGFDFKKIEPKLHGKSLLTSESSFF